MTDGSSFGGDLRRERELREVSLQEISEATKISMKFLHAIEENQFDLLPGGVFNVGFIRAYAKYLGIDDDQTVTHYLQTVEQLKAEGGEADQPDLAAALGAAESQGTGRRPHTPWIIAAVAVVVVAAAAASWYFFFR